MVVVPALILSILVLSSLFCFGVRLGINGIFIDDPVAIYLFENKYNSNKNNKADLMERARYIYLSVALSCSAMLMHALYDILS